MGVFSRFMDIVNANINTLLDKAEDPEKMIKLMIQEMEDTLIEMKSSCASKMASRVKVSEAYKSAEALVNRWQRRAELAISKDRDDLAREALLEKKKASADLDKLKEELDKYDSQISEARKDIEMLETKLNAVKLKYQSLLEKAARSRESQRAASFTSSFSASDRFADMEEKLDKMRAEFDAQGEPSTDRRFQDLEQMDEIEKELNDLKRRTGGVR